MNRYTRAKQNKRSTLFARHPGQAIVLIALVMVALLGFTALAVDGGQLYFLQRDAQNAADAAIVAALFELCKDPNLPTADQDGDSDIDLDDRAFLAIQAGHAAAIRNGFDDAANNVSVTVTVPYDPGTGLSYKEVEVVIIASKPAQLVQVVYQGPLEVRARTAGHCSPAYNWGQAAAMFAGGNCPDALKFTGSSATITGSPNAFHSNGGGTIQGNNGGAGGSEINGNGSTVGSLSMNNGVTYDPATGNPSTTTAKDPPTLWRIEDFAPSGLIAAKAATPGINAYYPLDGNVNSWGDFGAGHPRPGIYYVNGYIHLNDLDFDLTGVTLVATHDIMLQFGNGAGNALSPFDLLGAMSAANPSDPDLDNPRYQVMPAIFTPSGDADCGSGTNDNIKITGQAEWFGVIYAPNGEVDMTFSDGSSLDGAIIAYMMTISGSHFSITYNPDYMPPIPPEVGITG